MIILKESLMNFRKLFISGFMLVFVIAVDGLFCFRPNKDDKGRMAERDYGLHGSAR